MKFADLVFITDAERELVQDALLQEFVNQIDVFTECVIAWCAEKGIPAPKGIQEA